MLVVVPVRGSRRTRAGLLRLHRHSSGLFLLAATIVTVTLVVGMVVGLVKANLDLVLPPLVFRLVVVVEFRHPHLDLPPIRNSTSQWRRTRRRCSRRCRQRKT